MSYGYTEDDKGNKSSSRLVMVVSGCLMGSGCAAVLFASAHYVYFNGLANVPGVILAAAGPICAMAGVAYGISKTRPSQPDNSGSDTQ